MSVLHSGQQRPWLGQLSGCLVWLLRSSIPLYGCIRVDVGREVEGVLVNLRILEKKEKKRFFLRVW
jgi:hypothetical protein